MLSTSSQLLEALSDGSNDPESDVALEKTRLLFRNAGMAQAVVATNGAILVFVLGGMQPPAWALVWLLMVFAVAGARYGMARRFLASVPSAAGAMPWRTQAIRWSLVAGLLWGGGAMALMLADPGTTRLFAALVMAGMVAGAVPILSAVPEAFRAYAAPVMLSIIFTALADSHGVADWMLALVATLYLLALLHSARLFHDSLDSSIRLASRMRHMVDQLDEARRGAEASSQAKSQFLAMMSHEIRTPMNGILGMAQVLLDSGLSEDERRDFTRTILDSGQTLLILLNDILDLSKVEAGKLELTPSDCYPAAILADTAALFAESARGKNLRIETEWPGDADAMYWADANRLRQMLSNLVNNAIKFTAQGFVRIGAREIERSAQEAVLEFFVADSGIGIAADKQATLFQPFMQVDSSNTRQFGGTGLGLSIVRLLAQLMGGDVSVASAPGQGARFSFRVRVGVVPEDAITPPTRPGNMAADAPAKDARSGNKRILVVEDNPVNRKVVGAMLAKRGVAIEYCGNGELAVATLKGGAAFDLILMDCQMPIMDGYEATTRIRRSEQERQAARVPIIALTASAFDEDRNRCLDAGMDDFLTKPVGFAELDAMLDKWLR
ncbi:MAG: response regulator [Rhodocyclales bacterium]|nr:response regulator [Rhodocyclales bacterium]